MYWSIRVDQRMIKGYFSWIVFPGSAVSAPSASDAPAATESDPTVPLEGAQSTKSLLMEARRKIDQARVETLNESRPIFARRLQIERDKRCLELLMSRPEGMYTLECRDSPRVIQYYANVAMKAVEFRNTMVYPDGMKDHPFMQADVESAAAEREITARIVAINNESADIDAAWANVHVSNPNRVSSCGRIVRSLGAHGIAPIRHKRGDVYVGFYAPDGACVCNELIPYQLD